MINEPCPVCAEGILDPRVEIKDVEEKGHKGTVEMHFTVCSACGSEVAGATELKLNKRNMEVFRAQYVDPGQRICWINAPCNMIDRGDSIGTVESRDGEYIYCKMDGTGSIVELYPNEIRQLS